MSIIEGVHYSSKWVHAVAGLNNPCTSNLTRFSSDTAKKLCGVPVKKKKPFTAELITNMFMLHDPLSASLHHLRSLTVIVLGFSFFFC